VAERAEDRMGVGAARWRLGVAGAFAAAGLGLTLAASLALWASEGAGVFLDAAFAAVIACF
jgi:hypothetical protein